MRTAYLLTTTRGRTVVFADTPADLAAYIRIESEGRASNLGRLRSVRAIDTEAYVNRGEIVAMEA